MGRPDGAHTHGHGGGGVALVAVLVLLFAAIGKAAGKAVSEAGHVLAIVLEVVVIGLVSLVGLAVAAALGWAGLRLHRRYATRAAAAESRVVYQAVPAPPKPREIEPPRPRLYPLPGVHEEVTDDRS